MVAIGRNEGERLKRCLRSIPAGVPIVYVDSSSNDGSVDFARDRGVDVVELDMTKPFTAARARNEGFERLSKLHPNLDYVQFVDGDCEVEEGWIEAAMYFLASNPTVGAVCGRRRERFPEASFYNRLCDEEWNTPIGEAFACGGDAMMCVDALRAVGGFDSAMVAHEEPELSLRVLAAGHRICRIDVPMTLHDAAITRLSQWWKRNIRAGYGYAQAWQRHPRNPMNSGKTHLHRAILWVVVVPLATTLAALTLGPIGLVVLLAYPAQIVRIWLRSPRRDGMALRAALLALLAKFAEAQGAGRFLFDHALGNTRGAILYR